MGDDAIVAKGVVIGARSVSTLPVSEGLTHVIDQMWIERAPREAHHGQRGVESVEVHGGPARLELNRPCRLGASKAID